MKKGVEINQNNSREDFLKLLSWGSGRHHIVVVIFLVFSVIILDVFSVLSYVRLEEIRNENIKMKRSICEGSIRRGASLSPLDMDMLCGFKIGAPSPRSQLEVFIEDLSPLLIIIFVNGAGVYSIFKLFKVYQINQKIKQCLNQDAQK